MDTITITYMTMITTMITMTTAMTITITTMTIDKVTPERRREKCQTRTGKLPF